MDIAERKCINCTYFPCLRFDCKQDNVCEQHEFEHEEIIKNIERRNVK